MIVLKLGKMKKSKKINGSCWDYGSPFIKKATLIVIVLPVQSDHFLLGKLQFIPQINPQTLPHSAPQGMD